MFIIPMAGLSSRFFKAGYTIPKYQLLLREETVFEWSVRSFEKYFQTDKFIFIYRNVFQTDDFIKQKIKKLGIKNFDLICLEYETKGQADTVYQGIRDLEVDDEIYIFNIDSKIINFIKPSWIRKCSGYLEVFEGEGEHWSFVLADEKENVIFTAEKERISNLCSDGLYYFSKISSFKQVFLEARENNDMVKDEYYIAPLYNLLISKGQCIRYNLIDRNDILFCGTPTEYKNILENI